MQMVHSIHLSIQLLVEEYAKYSQIRWYMSHNYNIGAVDVWVRHKEKHKLTKGGLFWEYARPTQTIPKENTTLEVDVVDVRSRDRYLVALLQDENRKELPVIFSTLQNT
jgi:hypothetical protein